MFPDFGTEMNVVYAQAEISIDVIQPLINASAREQPMIIKPKPGGGDSDIEKMILEDSLSISSRAIIILRHPPVSIGGNQANGKDTTLLLVQSSRRSWIFRFRESDEKGMASVVDRDGFIKEIHDLLDKRRQDQAADRS